MTPLLFCHKQQKQNSTARCETMPVQQHNPPLLSLLSLISKTLISDQSKADSNVERGSNKQELQMLHYHRQNGRSHPPLGWRKQHVPVRYSAGTTSFILYQLFVHRICSTGFLSMNTLEQLVVKLLTSKLFLKKISTNINAVFKKHFKKNFSCQLILWKCIWW